MDRMTTHFICLCADDHPNLDVEIEAEHGIPKRDVVLAAYRALGDWLVAHPKGSDNA